MSNFLYRSLVVSAAAIVFAAFAYSGGFAQEMKKGEPTPAACKSVKEQAGCTARSDCSWVAASIDSKTNKEKRKAYCRTKPKAKAKAKT